jgi:hypothetical protein
LDDSFFLTFGATKILLNFSAFSSKDLGKQGMTDEEQLEIASKQSSNFH